MKTMNENFGGNDYPPMKLPKQEKADSSFDDICNDFDDFVKRSHEYFMWYGERQKSRRNGIRSTIFLEGLFLEMLTSIWCIILMRGNLL